MSKIIYICHRNRQASEEDIKRVKQISDQINPDNILAKETKIFRRDNLLYAVSNPNDTLDYYDSSVLLGKIFGAKKNWYQIHEHDIDGNYAIFRNNPDFFEVKSDILATRAIWFFQGENIFIASTSQLAIVKYLGNFSFDENVIPWMLSNGMLGPGISWDKRISLLPPDSYLLLDRKDWSFKIHTEKIDFEPNDKSDEENIKGLREIVNATFSELNLNYSQWKLSLSGGYDSRGNLCLLPKKDVNGNQLSAITWGLKESERAKGSDAYIARRIAKKFKVPHEYYHTNTDAESLELVLDRFFRNGEGRIDRIGGYTDGFKIWKTLYESNIFGIIRGDEVFGSYSFVSDFHLKKFIGLSLCSDYENLKDNDFLNSFRQKVPEQYERKETESVEQWRDRLYQGYLVPIFLSSLSDLKDKYVEQINPLLSREIVKEIRQLPDHLRTDKKAFKTIVDKLSPNERFASSSSTSTVEDFFEQEEMVNIIKKELASPLASKIFPTDFLILVQSKIRIKNPRKSMSYSLMIRIKKMIPKNFKRKLIKNILVAKMDMNLLAFRMFLILRMIQLFEEDTIEDFSKVSNNSIEGQV